MFEITAKAKLAGQLAAAIVVVTWGGLQIDSSIYHFSVQFDFGYLSIPITIIWIIGITNAINLIDGLDGLAAGVSTIALITITVMAIIMGNPFVVATAAILQQVHLDFCFSTFIQRKFLWGIRDRYFLAL